MKARGATPEPGSEPPGDTPLAARAATRYHRAVRHTLESDPSRRRLLKSVPAMVTLGGATLGGLAPPAAAAPPNLADIDPAASPAALARLQGRLDRLAEDGLDPHAYPAAPDIPPRAGLLRAAAAALADLLHGRVRELPNRADLRRDPAALPLGPWLAELAAAAEPAAVLDRAARLPQGAAVLKAALAVARAQVAAGGWPVIPGVAGLETLEPLAADPLRVPPLRARLGVAGPEALYDAPLVAAVRAFQAAEGIEADGRIGRLTIAALNRPAEHLVRQLRVALDMRRAAAAPPVERRIEVNIPHQTLQVIERGRVLLAMAVIVGKPARATPTLRVRLSAVQFNPPLGVPERNAREDLLPRFRRDPRAMMEKGFRVFGSVEGQRVEIDPTTIDWRGVNPERFPYVIRQDSGDASALGRIKFVIPNTEDIFMHDTPDRHLFRRPDRAFSSGCIRLEKPLELLDLALEGTAGWNRARVDRVLASRATSGIGVAHPIPVRLHYTSVTVEAGGLAVRPDLYGLDAAYARALDRPPSRVAAGPPAPTRIAVEAR